MLKAVMAHHRLNIGLASTIPTVFYDVRLDFQKAEVAESVFGGWISSAEK
jgi:hypothetical protein